MRGESDGTVLRLIGVLRHLAEEEGEVTVKGVAAALDLPPSTAHRLLAQLAGAGMVEADGRRHRYRPGLEYYRLAALISGRMDVAELARPIMEAVVAGCGETCLLGLYLPADRRMMFVARADSDHPLRYRLNMHRPLSVVWGASGRAILAFLPETEVAAILDSREASPASATPQPGAAAMRKQLAQVRARGYSVSSGEKIPGAIGIAAPVFRNGGEVVGSLSVTVPEIRYKAKSEASLATLVRAQANELSRALGASTPPAGRGVARRAS